MVVPKQLMEWGKAQKCAKSTGKYFTLHFYLLNLSKKQQNRWMN